MRTTLRGRILRVGCIGAILTGLILNTVALVGSFKLSENDGARLGEYAVSSCASSLGDEIDYLADVLAEAEVSEEGDATFSKIFMYGTDQTYNFGTYAKATLATVPAGETILTPPVKNADGDTVLLVAQNRADGTIVGELEYDYLASYMVVLDQSEYDTGYVIDAAGNLVLGVTIEETVMDINVAEYGLQDVIDAAAENESGSVVLEAEPLDGAKAMYTYLQLPGKGYTVVFANDYDNLMTYFYTVAAIMVAVMIVSIIVNATAGIKVSAKISKTVTDTTERLKLLSEGDVTTPFEANNRGDETQLLSEALESTIKSLSSYIGDIRYVLSEIGSGNLSVRSNEVYVGDFVEIKEALRNIKRQLIETIGEINSAGGEVLKGSNLLSNSSQDLASNSSREAASIEEINSMTADIINQVNMTTEKTQKAVDLLEAVLRNTEEGNNTMSEMNKAMDEISSSSNEIQKVVAIIDDIAFQTNILALNASVEAARAGEAGKGFAVVADEVRNLAAKSAEAAKNTMTLVDRSTSAVATGIGLTDDTQAALDAINQVIQEFDVLMGEISKATEDQAISLKQIGAGLDDMAQVVQMNSASAEESAASSINLKRQADILNEKVSEFRMEEE